MTRHCTCAVLLVVAGQLGFPDRASSAPGELQLRPIASGLVNPVHIASPHGDTNRLFILHIDGRILIRRKTTASLDPSPFLDASDDFLMAHAFAFDPDYANNGHLYIHGLLKSPSDVVVRRYTVSADPDVAEAESGRAVLTIAPDGRHNGGWVGFSPIDGFLYVTTGDASPPGAHDPENDAQNPDNLIGKLLRIDVDGDDFPGDDARNYAIPSTNPFAKGGGMGEVRCLGFRNPWRACFDAVTGDLLIADVGERSIEEINLLPAHDSGLRNYGWRLREGSVATPTGPFGGPPPANNVDPILEYGLDARYSVTGGYVYRGDKMPSLQGTYFYGDYNHNTMACFRVENGQAVDQTDLTGALQPEIGAVGGLASFGVDGEGEIYVLSYDNGMVHHLTRPYYVWLASQFPPSEFADSAVSGPAADPDRDRLPTLLEYVVGLHPGTASNTAAPFSYSAPGGKLTVRIDRSPDATGVTLSLESSRDLVSWSSDTTTVLQDTATVFEARDNIAAAPGEARYIRVVATLQ